MTRTELDREENNTYNVYVDVFKYTEVSFFVNRHNLFKVKKPVLFLLP